MKIAVTGANGFLGSKFVSGLQSPNWQTLALLRPNADPSLLSADQSIQTVDYTDVSSILSCLSGCDVLIHNAGKTRTSTFQEMMQANVGITARVLEAVNLSDIKHFIYISSQAASRPSPDGKPIDEEMASAPVNWYGKSKLWAERVIKQRCEKDWSIIRPVPVYGAGDRDFLSLFQMAKKGLSLSMANDKQILNMISAAQLTDFVKLCIQQPEARNQLFFASDGGEYTQASITEAISKAVGKRGIRLRIPKAMATTVFAGGELWAKFTHKSSVITWQKYLELSTSHWNCDISKARLLLGWAPQEDFEEQIKETYQWYCDHGWL
ncbi:MAG: sugar nucleotide-binding protein [Candidatus Cloacimonetes bacterium]|nr:sugar nucleotide-binding protein [Candidatus Cloacimonadota bacterium]NLO10961.1 sugar nucleotide-binding protein [Candidatus Cloacimonadota bacterium]